MLFYAQNSQALLKLWLWAKHIVIFHSQYFQEDFKVKAHINHSNSTVQSTFPTVGKTTLSQAGDATLAIGLVQINQNVWNSKHECLVSWCSFDTWTPRLTVDILGFVTGIVIQKTFFWNLFTQREKDFDVNCRLSSLCFPLKSVNSCKMSNRFKTNLKTFLLDETAWNFCPSHNDTGWSITDWHSRHFFSVSWKRKPWENPPSSKLQLSTLW